MNSWRSPGYTLVMTATVMMLAADASVARAGEGNSLLVLGMLLLGLAFMAAAWNLSQAPRNGSW